MRNSVKWNLDKKINLKEIMKREYSNCEKQKYDVLDRLTKINAKECIVYRPYAQEPLVERIKIYGITIMTKSMKELKQNKDLFAFIHMSKYLPIGVTEEQLHDIDMNRTRVMFHAANAAYFIFNPKDKKELYKTLMNLIASHNGISDTRMALKGMYGTKTSFAPLYNMRETRIKLLKSLKEIINGLK